MTNPNEKLLNALKKFYEYKSKELREKYPLNQTVGFYIGKVVDSWTGNTFFVLTVDGGYGLSSDDEYLRSLRDEQTSRMDKVYYMFYNNYGNIVKHLEALKQEEDALFRAVERMEVRDIKQEEFHL